MTLLNELYTVTSSATADGTYKYQLKLNRTHPIYSCHFPGNPITPGVCILQMITELCEVAMGRKLDIKEYGNVKYLSVISPDENPEITIEFNISGSTEETKIKAKVYNEKASFAKISAIYV